ncbi:uncharacterized protein METZ01_LOCUS192956, partial [marine metagenome]
MSQIKLSIVLPVFNEDGNLSLLYEEIRVVCTELGCTYEVIFIDDGSLDGSLDTLRAIQLKDSNVRVVQFRRNFGQTAALAAGFDIARGQVIATLDADCQNDPRDIPKMLEQLEDGYDLVCGWRYRRKDNFFSRTLPSKVANIFIGLLTDIKLHDYGCTLKVMRSDLAKSLKLYGEMHRLIPALSSSYGAKISEIKVNHRPRVSGMSKYGLTRTLRVILDVITVKFFLNFSNRPIQLFGSFGLLSTLCGVSILGIYGFRKIFLGMSLTDRPILLLAALLIVTGFQFITFGLLAELQVRTYH